jgi:hypothetical protein
MLLASGIRQITSSRRPARFTGRYAAPMKLFETTRVPGEFAQRFGRRRAFSDGRR